MNKSDNDIITNPMADPMDSVLTELDLPLNRNTSSRTNRKSDRSCYSTQSSRKIRLRKHLE